MGSSPASPVMVIKKARSRGSTRQKLCFAFFKPTDQLIANIQLIVDHLPWFAHTSESEAIKKGHGAIAEPLIDKISQGTIIVLFEFVYLVFRSSEASWWRNFFSLWRFLPAGAGTLPLAPHAGPAGIRGGGVEAKGLRSRVHQEPVSRWSIDFCRL